jgi:Ca-activated chloride channel family protein
VKKHRYKVSFSITTLIYVSLFLTYLVFVGHEFVVAQKEARIKAQELKRLLKKMKQKKMPTMMYQMNENNQSKRREGANPW